MTYFGTDGIRQKADQFTPEFLYALVQGLSNYAGKNAKILIGGDTRTSTKHIIAKLETILSTFGLEYGNVDILPTPAIYYCFAKLGFSFAIDVTASHNPASDNGIKIFELGEQGPQKLSPAGCAAIEEVLKASEETPISFTSILPAPPIDLHDATLKIYRQHLLDYVGTADLSSLNLGLDCANGAMSVLGDQIFKHLGAKVHAIHVDPNYGAKINQNCGSTHLSSLRELVLKHHLDFGIAFDGDGDRCLLIDQTGATVDGDQILVILANFLSLRTLATTVMANQGLLNWARAEGLICEITDVGDSNVSAAMREKALDLGGEQSGHIILPGQTTGDGMLTALMIAKAVAESGQPLADLARPMTRLPQIMVNLKASPTQKQSFLAGQADQLLSTYSHQLEQISGRLLVRPSGTENLIRVTMWGSDADQIDIWAHELAKKLEETL